MPMPSPESDLQACRALMRGGSRSFFAASHLLPRHVRDPATALYAFCRLADDAIDEGGQTMAALHDRLDRAYAGRPCAHAADRAFARTVQAHHLPRALLLALLEGFAWDSQGRRYATLEELLDYAARVAGSVGAMMAVLMRARSGPALARACDLGVAMQLTNIARDVGEDARAGRLYLPMDWLREAGIEPEAFLRDPRPSAALAGVVERLLRVAAGLYQRGGRGVAALPASCRPGIRAAGTIYGAIGGSVARQNHDSVTRRARVSGRRKLALAALSAFPAWPTLALDDAPALPACQFLVDAALGTAPATRRALSRNRLDWTFDLFMRLHAEQWEAS